jgi:cell wall-associated NlpC family hydrolase
MALFQKPIALDPITGGGLCIDCNALQPADIIVSTTRAGVSGIIRVGTESLVSHAALYIGKGEVIEAIGKGVTRHDLTAALAEDVLAVAYRSPAMTRAIADGVVHYAVLQVGLSYSVAGAVLSTDKILCRLLAPRPASFFCSQLVFESYRRGGLPLTDLPSQCITPNDVVIIAQHRLSYVGHILGNPSWFPIIAP